MLAVLSLAATSRSCSALAIAGPSFSAVARGAPSIGAIVTLALSRKVNIGEPFCGTSSANGWGSGWQPAVHRTTAAAAPPTAPGEAAARKRRTESDTVLTARDSRLARRGGAAENDCRESTTVHAFATQATAPVTEKAILLGGRIVSGAFDCHDTGPNEPALNIARQIKHEMSSPQRGGKERGASWVLC